MQKAPLENNPKTPPASTKKLHSAAMRLSVPHPAPHCAHFEAKPLPDREASFARKQRSIAVVGTMTNK